MMNHKLLGGSLLVSLVVFTLSACAAGGTKPSHYGFFLKENGRLIEMRQFTGSPDPAVTAGIPTTKATQPAILAWHNRINPQWLELFSGYGEGDRIAYDTTPKPDGQLELRPQKPLKPGDGYCFVQGDPLGTPYQLATWCFTVAKDATARASTSTTGSLRVPLWLLLVGLGVLLIGAVAIFFGFGRVRGIRETAQTGISAGKWRVQALKLSNDQARLEKQRDKTIADLGALAWEQRVSHPDYADTFAQLSALEEQRGQGQQELAALNADVQHETDGQNQIKADFAARSAPVQQRKDAATRQLQQLRTDHQAAAKRLAAVEKQQQTANADLRSMHDKLKRAQASTANDREERIALLTSGIAALERSLADLSAQTPALQAEVARLDEAQRPFVAEVAEYERQLAQLQAEQKAALDPIAERLTTLQGQIRATHERIAAWTGQMQPLITGLGSQVEHARPAASGLVNAYAEVDRLHRDIADLTSQGDLLKARLAGLDASALRKFYLLIGATLAVILVAAALVFAVAGGAFGGSAESPLIGRWAQIDQRSHVIEFLNDGTARWGDTLIRYRVEGDRVHLEGGGAVMTAEFRVAGENLTLALPDEVLRFQRVKP